MNTCLACLDSWFEFYSSILRHSCNRFSCHLTERTVACLTSDPLGGRMSVPSGRSRHSWAPPATCSILVWIRPILTSHHEQTHCQFSSTEPNTLLSNQCFKAFQLPGNLLNPGKGEKTYNNTETRLYKPSSPWCIMIQHIYIYTHTVLFFLTSDMQRSADCHVQSFEPSKSFSIRVPTKGDYLPADGKTKFPL